MKQGAIPPIINPRSTKYDWANLEIGGKLVIRDCSKAKQGSVLTAGKEYFKRHGVDTKLETRRKGNTVTVYRTA